MWSLCVVSVLLLGPVLGQGPIDSTKDVGVSIDLPPEMISRLAVLAASDVSVTPGITAQINDYLDKVMFNIGKLLIRQGYDPVELPDQHQGFSKRIIFITYHGEFDLKKGWLYDIGTIKRSGDATIKYEPSTKKITIVVPIGFDDMMFNYKYSAKFMNLGPIGGVNGKVKNVKVETTIEIDLANFSAKLLKCATGTGHIDVEFTGHFLIDWMLDMFSEMTTTLLHPLIIGIVNDIVKSMLTVAVTDINEILQAILNPPEPTEAPTTAATAAAPAFFAYRNYGM